MWFGFILAVPSTVPSESTATTVRLGAVSIHIALACSSLTSGSHV